jgi:hypothetical protein
VTKFWNPWGQVEDKTGDKTEDKTEDETKTTTLKCPFPIGGKAKTAEAVEVNSK